MSPRRSDLTPREDEHPVIRGPGRLTPVGAGILSILAASVVALFAGSHTLQSLGAAAIIVILVVFIAAKSPRNRNR